LKIYSQLAQQNPPHTCRTWPHIEQLWNFDTENRMDEGRQHYEDALKIYRHLAQQTSRILARRGRDIEQPGALGKTPAAPERSAPAR